MRKLFQGSLLALFMGIGLAQAAEIVVKVAPPRVKDSPVSIECRLHSTNELGDSTVVLGEVLLITVADEVLVDGHPEYDRLDPLARLGKNEWGVHPQVTSIRRPRTPDDIESS